VNALSKTNSKSFHYPSKRISKISTAKVKKYILFEPQTREILEDEGFVETLLDTERAAWESVKWVSANFLGRKISADFSDGIQKLLNEYKETECHMSLKVHFLHSH
jgi:hypothetical protein